MSRQDCLVDVGTGYGKTLCMILPSLLDSPRTISIVISPLKRLQAVQVHEFERYGISTVAINEDTPNDPELWKVGSWVNPLTIFDFLKSRTLALGNFPYFLFSLNNFL